jgi:hypothetical protein
MEPSGKTIRELLRDADPLQQEPGLEPGAHDSSCQALLAAALGEVRSEKRSKSRIVVFASVAALAIGASFFGSHGWSLFVSDLQAAVRFEVRLAEDKPAPGLREVKLPGSEKLVYLHGDPIVTNSDIAAARVIEGGGPAQYSVGVEFKTAGAEKMRAATANHIGRPVAILLDGQVVAAPTLRSAIGGSAVISGNFTRDQAAKIVKGIELTE